MLEIRLNSSAQQRLGQVVERRNGDKVHFCLSCDFPIAIYGRLEPCHHIFCFICARKNSTCFLCERKIATVKRYEMLQGMYVCGAARCFKSFLERGEFEAHVRDAHRNLLSSGGVDERVGQAKTVKPLERQSRQQQFRNAQQQRLKYHESTTYNINFSIQ